MITPAARRAFLREVLPQWKARWETSATKYRADGAASVADAAEAHAVAANDDFTLRAATLKVCYLLF